MVKLNLKADTAELEVLKSYLEENASPTLVEKIENGVKIKKDGKILVNKKLIILLNFMIQLMKQIQL